MADKKKKENNNASLNMKITIITLIIIVWVVCLALVVSKCEAEKAPDNPETTVQEDDYTHSIPSYEGKETGKVSKENSKTIAYYNTHYKGDYYSITEYEIASETEGTYYQTETIAWSAQGYKYKRVDNCSYEEIGLYDDAIEYLLTPTNAYVMYPDMKVYFNSQGSTEGYSTEVTFKNEEFVTGTVNVNGKDYYYEETTTDEGITSKLCYDENGDLKYTLSTTNGAIVVATYIEYSEEVDYSLFEIPSDYVLEE